MRAVRSLLISLFLVIAAIAPATPSYAGGASVQVAQSAHWVVTAPPEPPLQAVQMLVEFEPGTAVEPHRHGGVAYITVLDGAITLENRGQENVFERGSAFLEIPTEVYSAWNDGPETVRLLVTYLIPTGSPLTTLEASGPTEGLPPGPEIPYQATFDLASRPDAFEFSHLLIRLQPGAASAPTVASGDTFVLVFSGWLTIEDATGSRVYGPGDAVTIPDGAETVWRNDGAEPVEAGVLIMTPGGGVASS